MIDTLLSLLCISVCVSLLYGAMSVSLRINRTMVQYHDVFNGFSEFFFHSSEEACRDICLIEEVILH